MTICQGCGVDTEKEEEDTGVEHECSQPKDWDQGVEWTT